MTSAILCLPAECVPTLHEEYSTLLEEMIKRGRLEDIRFMCLIYPTRAIRKMALPNGNSVFIETRESYQEEFDLVMRHRVGFMGVKLRRVTCHWALQ